MFCTLFIGDYPSSFEQEDLEEYVDSHHWRNKSQKEGIIHM